METFDKVKLDLFKLLLTDYIKRNFNVCSSFEKKLIESDSELSIKNVFIDHVDDVTEFLGGYDNEYEESLRDAENDIRELKREISNLEEEIEKLRGDLPYVMESEYRLRAFYDNQSKYTTWDLETLLENGEEFLKQKKK